MRNRTRHFFELLYVMTEKELRARYKHTALGFFWLVANPLMQMLVIGFVFTYFMKEQMPHYYFYLFTGLLVWNFFSLSLTKATPSIVFERMLIKKALFPQAVIPLSIILSNAIHMVLAQIIFLIPICFIGTLSWSRIGYIFPAYAILLTFTIGLSLFTSALNVKFRDINFIVQALIIVWFYGVPIVYSFSIIPEKYVWIWRLSPMTSVLQLFQHAFVNYPLPDQAMLIENVVVTVLVTVLGVLVFHRESKYFDDWI